MTLKADVKVKGRTIGATHPPYLVAEMACAHQGREELAAKIVDHAVAVKADAMQFQIFAAETLCSTYHPLYETFQKLALPKDAWLRLMQRARDSGLAVWVNVFDLAAVDTAKEFGADAIKLHSTDLMNPEMLDAAANVGCPLSLAIGGSTLEEADWALERLQDQGVDQVILMHGYQGFPTKLEDNRLNFIRTLQSRYSIPVGFQDHADGSTESAMWLPLMGVAAGANLIEKHLTHDENLSDIDHESSLSPLRFQEFVGEFRKAITTTGPAEEQPLSEGEIEYRHKMKKMVVAADDLPMGTVIEPEHVTFLRSHPAGLSPKEVGLVIGLKTERNYNKGETLLPENLQSRKAS